MLDRFRLVSSGCYQVSRCGCATSLIANREDVPSTTLLVTEDFFLIIIIIIIIIQASRPLWYALWRINLLNLITLPFKI